MLIVGRIFHPDRSDDAHPLGWVELQGTQIRDVGEGFPAAKPDFGDEECWIFPGFIDAHVHLPQFDSVGVAGLELLDWLDQVIFPAEERWADPAFACDMAERATDELISFGTTGFAAYGTVHSESVIEASRGIAARGVRCAFGPSLMDRRAPASLCRDTNAQLEALAKMRPIGRLSPAVTPRFAVACSSELMTKAGVLARERNWLIQTHLAETKAELALIAELFDGRAYAHVYDDHGLLTPRTILGHGIWLGDQERALLAERQAVVAHCPTANRFLQAGAMDRAELVRSGVRQALGTDVAGGPDRSMVRVARAMVETAWARGDEPPSARDAFRQITMGNAEALGWHETGRIGAGCEADLVVVRPTMPLNDHPDPLGALLHGWDDRWIEQTIVAGMVEHDARWLTM